MIKRYSDDRITQIWSEENKVANWQKVELAVLEGRAILGRIPKTVLATIKQLLEANPCDIKYWHDKEKATDHDLNAWLMERLRFLPENMQEYLHQLLTSYDTEEPAFAIMLLQSIEVVESEAIKFRLLLRVLAQKYRYTPMFGRTHGQYAKLQSFGKRIFTWHQRLQLSLDELARAKELIRYSKLSGAVGNYQGLSPLEEAKALELLGLKPYVGATQIMPREIFQPLVNALVELVGSLTQIAEDFRLAARSGNTLMQEPFGKQQMGSSAMPHKKNTIKTENQMGMYTMAKGFASMLRDRMITWEERAIEQSCVERVAWPNLFQVVIQSFKNLFKVLDQEKIQIFVDNMMEEIKLSGGCYAAEEAKEFLKHYCAKEGLPYEQAYRIVQLAAFMIHNPSATRKAMRDNPPKSLVEAQEMLKSLQIDLYRDSIQMIILDAQLEPLTALKPDSFSDEQWEERVEDWNQILLRVFSTPEIKHAWDELFNITYQLKGENYLFEQLAA